MVYYVLFAPYINIPTLCQVLWRSCMPTVYLTASPLEPLRLRAWHLYCHWETAELYTWVIQCKLRRHQTSARKLERKIDNMLKSLSARVKFDNQPVLEGASILTPEARNMQLQQGLPFRHSTQIPTSNHNPLNRNVLNIGIQTPTFTTHRNHSISG